jgi:hypothetical protein
MAKDEDTMQGRRVQASKVLGAGGGGTGWMRVC